MKKIKVIVNPFTRELVIVYTLDECKYTVKKHYKDNDEWLYIGSQEEDFLAVHVFYEKGFTLSAYQVIDGVICYDKQVDVNIVISYPI